MEIIDFSKLSDNDKNIALKLFLEGKKKLARRYIEEVMAKAKENVAETLQETDCLYDDLSIRSVQRFLQYAPKDVIRFFNDRLNDEEKLMIMKTFKYNPTTIDILDKQGNIVETLERENHTVPNEQLQPGTIERDEAGNTIFSFDAIKDDELVLTKDEWEKLISLMPPSYDNDKQHAGNYLFELIGARYHRGENLNLLWTRSICNDEAAYLFRADGNTGGFIYDIFKRLYPIRRRIRTAT